MNRGGIEIVKFTKRGGGSYGFGVQRQPVGHHLLPHFFSHRPEKIPRVESLAQPAIQLFGRDLELYGRGHSYGSIANIQSTTALFAESPSHFIYANENSSTIQTVLCILYLEF